MAKRIFMTHNVNRLVELAKKSDRKAQLALYDMYASKMLGVCQQYIRDKHFAEDTMLVAFHKALSNLKKYDPYGSFEGWLRRIMVRECISYLRVQKNKFDVVELEEYTFQNEFVTITNEEDEVQQAINTLPVGCKTVFNLFVVEGYSHKEISVLLKISVGTSKSQLSHAKKLLKCKLSQVNEKENGTR